MTPDVVLPGAKAAPGLAIGPIALQQRVALAERISGAPEEERQALSAAIAAAAAQLGALHEAAPTEMAGDILEFQIALLEDEELVEPILAAAAAGAPAHRAWTDALDREIADYRDTDDETFRARAADLVDLRDRVLRALSGTHAVAASPEQPAIYADLELTPSRFLEIDWNCYLGAATRDGSTAGHVALLARARGLPLLVGLGAGFENLRDGMPAVLDAERGHLVLEPGPDTLGQARHRLATRAASAAAMQGYLARPAVTGDGQPVHVGINVDDPSLLHSIDHASCDGIGLTRTELLFQGGALPDEERQYEAYCRLLDWAGGRPVIVRTLDAGGDKPIAGLTIEGERNPFLGLRGLRLSLARPEVFRLQLRALARAAARGDLRVMVPMVTTPAELAAARQLFDAELAALQATGIDAAPAPLGMMVEVPAAALRAADFAADFYSIGSNDLIQYVTAASRDDARVAALHDPANPAAHDLIRLVVEAGRRRSVEVSLCGDMASDPACLPTLLDLGLRRISVAPARLAAVKAAIAAWPAA